jgi:colanic acid biosynthesis glycosyl transferase WcaI
MKILLLNQFFWPDSAATSQLLTDLARGLAERGHEVSAVCAGTGYAVVCESTAPPVAIHRVRAVPFVRGKLGRALSYASYFLSCAVQGLLLPRPDLVITLTTPPLLSLIGTLIKRLRGSRHFIWEMDVYPDVAVDLDFFPAGGIAERVTGLLADFSRRHADGILALGECMRERLMARGIPAGQIHVAENWADGRSIQPLPRPPGEERLVILYSGNLGLAHDVDTIFEAMKTLKHETRFRFDFAGGGPLRKQFEEACQREQLESADFRDYSQRTSLGESLASGDIGLVTQRTACLGSVVPSKVYGLLAAGRPVLFIGPARSTVAQIIRRYHCGWHMECGDHSTLVELLRFLEANRSQVEAAGEHGRQAFLQNYDLHLGVSRICALVGAAADSGTPERLAHTADVFTNYGRRKEIPARD